MARRDLPPLTEEQIREMRGEFASLAGKPVPRLPITPAAPSYDAAPAAPQMLDAQWPGGAFRGADTPEARAFVDSKLQPLLDPIRAEQGQQRDMLASLLPHAFPNLTTGEVAALESDLLPTRAPQPPSPPADAAPQEPPPSPVPTQPADKRGPLTDDELLNPTAPTSRPAPESLPEMPGDSLDDLIAAESARMDREQAAAAAPVPAAQPQPQRPSREDVLLETFAPPSRMQGIAALLGDAFLGGDRVNQVANRQQGYRNALAQARVGDIEAGELADKQAADRAMVDERLRLQMRGQDLANERSEENRTWQREKAEQTDKRLRELEDQRQEGLNARTDKMLGAKGPGVAGADPATLAMMEASHLARTASVFGSGNRVSIEQAQKFQANPHATAEELGVTPQQLETLKEEQATIAGLKASNPQKYGELVTHGAKREGSTTDQTGAARARKIADPKVRADIKTGIDEIGRTIALAEDAWNKMSDTGKKAFARLVPEGNFESAVRQGLMTEADQRYAARVQALANGLVKSRAGSAVTANEWKRVAGEIGFAQNDWSLFNSPTVITDWILRSKTGLMGRMKAYDSEYMTEDGKGLFDAP